MFEYLKNEKGFLHKSAFTAFFVDTATEIWEAITNPSPGPKGGDAFLDPVSQQIELQTPPGGLSPGITVDVTKILPVGLGGGQPVGFSLASFGQQLLTDVGIPFISQAVLGRTPAIMPVSSVRTIGPVDPFGPFVDNMQAGTGVSQVALRLPGAAVGGFAAARGAISALLKLASMKIGRRMTRASAVSLVKRIGIEAAALALGLSIVEMASIVASAPSRRSRGISASDVKRTKRTLRKINSIACQLKETVGSRASFGRKKAVCK